MPDEEETVLCNKCRKELNAAVQPGTPYKALCAQCSPYGFQTISTQRRTPLENIPVTLDLNQGGLVSKPGESSDG